MTHARDFKKKMAPFGLWFGSRGRAAIITSAVNSGIGARLRASTDEQDANRACDQLKAFAAERGLEIVAWYVENESRAKLARPELFRLLSDAHRGTYCLSNRSTAFRVSR
jgi:hypothetical protein